MNDNLFIRRKIRVIRYKILKKKLGKTNKILAKRKNQILFRRYKESIKKRGKTLIKKSNNLIKERKNMIIKRGGKKLAVSIGDRRSSKMSSFIMQHYLILSRDYSFIKSRKPKKYITKYFKIYKI